MSRTRTRRGRPFLGPAVEENGDDVERRLAEAFDRVARRHGFR